MKEKNTWNEFLKKEHPTDLTSYDRIAKIIGRDQKILDIGAGKGFLARHLNQFNNRVTALDICTEYLKNLTDISVKEHSLPTIPYKDKSFDFITATNVVEFISDLDELLSEMTKVSKCSLITVPKVITSDLQLHSFANVTVLNTVLSRYFKEVYFEEFIEQKVLGPDGPIASIPSILAYCYPHERPKKKVMLAVPHSGNLRAELVDFLLRYNSFGHDVKILLSYGRPITVNRNKIVQIFLESDFEYLLQIDSDLIPQSNIMLMVDNDLDICSADIKTYKDGEVLRLGLKEYEPSKYVKKTDFLENGINEVDSCGTGCFLVKRKVFELIGGFETHAEDFDFCQRARAFDYKVYFDTRFHTNHYVTIPV